MFCVNNANCFMAREHRSSIGEVERPARCFCRGFLVSGHFRKVDHREVPPPEMGIGEGNAGHF